MFVKEKKSDDLIRVSEIDQLANPLEPSVSGRPQAGEEEQDEREFPKSELVFPSGEALPKCWTDQSYQVQ